MDTSKEELLSEILAAATERGYVTSMEKHLLEVEIGPEAVETARNAAHRAKVIKNGGRVFGA